MFHYCPDHPTWSSEIESGDAEEVHVEGYAVPGFQITGGPQCVSTDRWDFEAPTDTPAPFATERRRQRLRKLLEGCFQLRAHRETRSMPIYELTRVSRGPNLLDEPGLDARGR